MTVSDPIGVQHEANAQDEYDSYIGGTYELLVTGATDKQLVEHLLRIVQEPMGLEAATEEHMLATVKALRDISLLG